MPSPFRRILYAGPFSEDEDPNAAPIAHCSPSSAPPFTLRRAAQNQIWTFVIGLIFLLYTVQGIDSGDPGPLRLALRFVGLAVIGLAYLGAAWVADTRLAVRWTYLIGFLLLTASTAEYNGWDWVDLGAYVSIMVVALIPWRTSRWLLIGWNAALVAMALIQWNMTPAFIALIGTFFGLVMGIMIEGGRLRHQLDRAEQRVSVLSVAAERERIARDLHDILGHSLTAISIKSGLAARLADADPAAAREQMLEVERIARVALGDVRATTTGLRQVRLATEIASARSVLLAAGVEAAVPSAVPALVDRDSELLGYAVREAVTNVVRHAEATRVVIRIEDRAVIISDDGVGLPTARPRGSGIDGLRRRFADAGGTFSIRSGSAGGTVVRAELAPRAVKDPEPVAGPALEHVEGQPA